MEPVAAHPPSAPTRLAGESDWGGFLDSYGRAAIGWFRGAEVSPAEATRLARDILQVLAREFATFCKGPRTGFRAWLKTAAHSAWCRLMDAQVEAGVEPTGSPVSTLLNSDEAHDAFLKVLDLECTHQRRRAAMTRVQERAEPADWEAFWLTVVESMSIAEVAAHLQGNELAVRAAVHRVRRLLGDDLRLIEESC